MRAWPRSASRRRRSRRERAALGRRQERGLIPEVPEQDVEVADRAQEIAEPRQLRAERLDPLGGEHRPRGAQEGPEPPRRHAHLVEVFGVASEPRAGVVGQHRGELRPDHGGEVLGGRRGGVGRSRRRRGRQIERLEELGPPVPIGGAGRAEGLLDLAERGLVPVEQLDLELAETAEHLPAVEQRHGVDDHVGDRARQAPHADAGAARAERRHRGRLVAPCVRGHQLTHLVGGVSGPARHFQLQAGGAPRELELPGTPPPLGATPQRDAGAGQPIVRRVVVRRGEDPGRQPIAGQGGEPEAGADGELQLALEGSLHGRIAVSGRACSRRRGRRPCNTRPASGS